MTKADAYGASPMTDTDMKAEGFAFFAWYRLCFPYKSAFSCEGMACTFPGCVVASLWSNSDERN